MKEPVFAHIKSGENMATGILIAAGDELHAEQITSAFDKWNGTYSFQLEGNDFLKAKDSLRMSYDQLSSKLKTNPEVPVEKLDLLRRYADMHVIFYQHNFAAGKDSVEIPRSVREVLQKFPVDTMALKAGISDYGLIGAFFIVIKSAMLFIKKMMKLRATPWKPFSHY